MNARTQQSNVLTDAKNRYEILDGLRGVAALTVVLFHIFEIFSEGNHQKQIINHGYLAVDFFFLLSGFVIGYAYDDRWGKITLNDFFKRRFIRLHPMIIIGMAIGAVCFYPSASSVLFPKIGATPFSQMLFTMAVGFTLIPLPLSMDIRGWTEMYPLNGPAWSLFYEYVANILYALFLRKVSNIALALLTVLAGAALVHMAVTSPSGDVIGGWSLEPSQMRIGITRLLFPFLAGLLLSRTCQLGHIKHAFLWCSLLIVLVLSFPHVGEPEKAWMNGLYDSACILFVFPFIIYIGASGEIKGELTTQLCRFLGDISYPIYITHYPLVYIYMAWVVNNQIPLTSWQAILVGCSVFLATIALAYACLKLYDVPMRKWLSDRWTKR